MQIPTRKSEQNIRRTKADPYITQAKFDELQKSLTRLKKAQIPAIKEVERLALLGDFSENAEYQQAKGKLRGINWRMLKIQDQLNHSKIIQPNQNKETVQLGALVTVEINSKEKTYQILGSAETNPSTGIISQNSPLGSALINHKIGDIFDVELGGKIVQCKIIRIG